MLLDLEAHHKEDLTSLTKYSNQALENFCQLASNNIKKEADAISYINIAKQYDVEANILKHNVTSLVNLIIESCKIKLNEDNFKDVLSSLGFNESQIPILLEFYNSHKNEVVENLSYMGLKCSQYHDLDWRFEVQIGSRAVMKQVIPLVTMDLVLKNEDKVKHIPLQTDPNNLKHLVQELDIALEEGLSEHMRNIAKITK